MTTRILILHNGSCPHDLFGVFQLASKAVTFVPSELTKAFRDGDKLSVTGLHLTDAELAKAVYAVAADLEKIELPDGTKIERHPNFTVVLEPRGAYD